MIVSSASIMIIADDRRLRLPELHVSFMYAPK